MFISIIQIVKKLWLCPVRQQRENCLKKKDANKTTTEAVHLKCPPFLCRFSAWTWGKFSYFTNSKVTFGVNFIFIVSLMHTLSDKVRFVQRKLKPEEAFTTKKWMVLAEHLLAQAHIQSFLACGYTRNYNNRNSVTVHFYLALLYTVPSLYTVPAISMNGPLGLLIQEIGGTEMLLLFISFSC